MILSGAVGLKDKAATYDVLWAIESNPLFRKGDAEVSEKKEDKKDKGKLRQLIKAIHSAEPTKTNYIVLIIDFYDAPTTHLTLTPFNVEKIIVILIKPSII